VEAGCGWAVTEPPIGDFEGDSTYTWSIIFAPGSEKRCVVYWASMATCDSAPPAKFYVAEARVKDSAGAIDTLRNIGDAKLLGGPLPDTLPSSPQFGSGNRAPSPQLSLVAVPNPALSEIELRFELPSAVPFNLGIYDVGGRLIRRPAVTPHANGSGSYRWDLTDAAGQRVQVGLYFARIMTAAGSRVIPLTVLK
jgi:hypothetical protein